MQQKLASWKSKNLSLAGRITLCKPMLSAVPLYPMHSSLLPEATCNETEKICRRFINEGKERLHRVRWKTVCKSKQDGFLFLPISFFQVTLTLFCFFVYIPCDLHCSACAWFLRIFKDGLGFDFADQSSMALKIENEIPRTRLDEKTKIHVPS